MKIILNNKDSIEKAIQNCKENDEIYLKNGIYTEKVFITKSNIKITGESKDGVIIKNKDFYHKILSDNNECNTFRTYTVYIGGDNVIIENLTIENTSTPSSKYGQAIALYADGNNLVFNNIILKSAQDTLFTGPLPLDLIKRYTGFLNEYQLRGTPSKQRYTNCTIIGDIDFIFGSATVLFDNCKIISLNNNHGYICAPAHLENTQYGYLFYQCSLECESGATNVYLARPWRDFGTAAFIDCTYQNHICKEGFNKWDNTNRDKTARFYEYNQNINEGDRVKWAHILSKNEKNEYYNNFMKYLNK